MKENRRFSGLIFSNPRHFDVKYKINPYMNDSKVNKQKMYQQWIKSIRRVRENGIRVNTINYDTYTETEKNTSELPDLVFCANHATPIPSEDAYILSNMNKKQRKGEPAYFKKWAIQNNYKIFELADNLSFEGAGDTEWHPKRNLMWIGYGYRTDKETVNKIDDMLDAKVCSLELTDRRYYHLDVCFEPLDENTVVIIPEAFTSTGLDKISSEFEDIIEVPEEDTGSMGGNCSRLNGGKVLIDGRNQKTINSIQKKGFEVIRLNTGEFMKSGGSIDCLFNKIV